ncbi:MAG TPA: MMPL family transporter [Thermoleophilaceae bacterium]|nr:MMPL family transporter [Thermoleophilaceae bacterium]
MAKATNFALRRSKLVIGAWIAVVGVCASLGFASGDAFKPTVVNPPGTDTARWTDFTAESAFGVNLNVLLTGPKPELREQGAIMTKRLRALEGVGVVSPFERARTGGGRQGSPFARAKGNSALFVTDIELRSGQALDDALPPVNRVVDATVRPPLTSHVTGMPAVVKGLADETERDTRRSELIAAPILILVLLLVFRSPAAAAIPAIMGFGTVGAGTGLVRSLATITPVDQMALIFCSMMGLALGVDYSLLLVSRYRELRRADPGAVRANIAAASRVTGRTIGFAAVLLLAVMGAAALLTVGPFLLSTAIGVGIATIFASITALLVVPAMLQELDPWLERWRLPERRRKRDGWFARRQPVVVPIVALIALLALATPTLGIDLGPPDVKQLPEDNRARMDYEAMRKVLGPGFGSLFDVAIKSTNDRPLTRPQTMAAISRVERAIAADPDVSNVTGPSQLAGAARGANQLERGLQGQRRGLARLERGLTRAADGSLRSSGASRQLHDATGAAYGGAARLAARLRDAKGGSEQLTGGIASTSDGGERVARGSSRASAGAERLSGALAQARSSSGLLSNNATVLQNDLRTGDDQLSSAQQPVETVEQRLQAAWDALERMTTGRADPQYQATLDAIGAASLALTGTDPGSGEQPDPAYEGVAGRIQDARGQLSLGLYLSERLKDQGRQTEESVDGLARGAERLDAGIGQVEAGSAKLAAGLDRLRRASAPLPGGLDRLSGGAGLLKDGLARIDAGSGQLAAGIGSPQAPGTLTNGLSRMQASVERQRDGAQSGSLTASSPELFSSGSLPIALISGAPRATRDPAQFVVDLSNSGRSARMLVVPTITTSDPRMVGLHDRIAEQADGLRGDGVDVAVGGPVAALQDFKDVMTARMPWVIFAFALVSLLVLILAVRAVPLAALCVALNLLTVGVAFGAMQLGFGGSDPLLGGPGYVELISMSGALAVIFALSIDYQVFLVARMREEYLASGSNERAIVSALGSTGGVITGAAAVMVAIFLAFCTAGHTGVRGVGVGLAVAVLLDATIVRLVLLPAAMRAIGDRVWWMPGWLDRRLPNVSL